MPTISGPLKTVLSNASQVTGAWIRASEDRPEGGGVVLDEQDRVTVTGGTVSFTALPGPAVLILERAGGRPTNLKLVIGQQDSSLAEAYRAGLVAGSIDAHRLAQLVGMIEATQNNAANAHEQANRARDEADRAAGALSTKADKVHLHSSAEITDTTSNVGVAASADRVLRTNAEGKLFIPTGSITSQGDPTNKAYVDARALAEARSEVAKIVGTAPETFDTLEEIADELASNSSDRAALTNMISEKADRSAMVTADNALGQRIDGKADKSAMEAADTALGQQIDVVSESVEHLLPVTASEAAGTTWAHTAEDGTRLPLGYGSDGLLDEYARTTWSEQVHGVYDTVYDQDYARVYTTSSGHVLASIMRDGTVEIPRLRLPSPESSGIGLSRREQYRRTDGTLAPVLADTAHISGWGSSSMEGMASEIAQAVADLPVTYHDHAKGGEYIQHNAARMGAIPALVGPTTIPDSGGVTVIVSNLPININMKPFTGWLGGVHGTLSSSATEFSFTRTDPGDPVVLSGEAEFIPDIDPAIRDHTTILQLGKNNIWVASAVADVTRISTEMLTYLRPLMPRVLILGHHANRNWERPANEYVHIRLAQFNAHMLHLAGPDNFIDVQEIITGTDIWDRTGITPTPDDLAHQADGRMPPSLARDNIHFNDSTDQAMAEIIRERIDYLDWY